MILLNKEPPSDEPQSSDAPPAYDELAPEFQWDNKGQSHTPPPPQNAASSTPGAGPSGRSPVTPKSSNAASSQNKHWFGLGSWFSEKGSRKEVKQTIQSLMRDVVKEPAAPASVSVVQSCLEACQAHGLSFESIVSEKFIEGRSPLYWAIVKLPPLSLDPQDDTVHLLDILLSFPLNSATRSDAYLACLLSSDQVLFQRLRRTPGCQLPSVSAAAELLLGDAAQDELTVENTDGDHGEFRVNWTIPQFQKRMRVVGGIGTELVARGRIWCLAFIVLPKDTTLNGHHVKAGSWVVSVSLLSPSPPTHLKAQFSISEPTPNPQATPSDQPSSPSSPSHAPAPPSSPPAAQIRKHSLRWPSSSEHAQKPPIHLKIRTTTGELEALPLDSTTSDLRDHVLGQRGLKTLTIPLSSHPYGASLQFDGCTYLSADGSLSVTFEAILARSNGGGDCVIS